MSQHVCKIKKYLRKTVILRLQLLRFQSTSNYYFWILKEILNVYVMQFHHVLHNGHSPTMMNQILRRFSFGKLFCSEYISETSFNGKFVPANVTDVWEFEYKLMLVLIHYLELKSLGTTFPGSFT